MKRLSDLLLFAAVALWLGLVAAWIAIGDLLAARRRRARSRRLARRPYRRPAPAWLSA